MNHASILFQFEDHKSAELAFDTLSELGYDPMFHDPSNRAMLHIHVEHRDLTSALEIAQAHGGRLIDSPSDEGETPISVNSLYVDEIQIPAHTVNEDWLDA